MMTMIDSNSEALGHDTTIADIVWANTDFSQYETVYRLFHMIENQIDAFGAYRYLRGWWKANQDQPKPDAIKGTGMELYNDLISRVHPIAIYGRAVGGSTKKIFFDIKYINRIVLDTEICTPKASSRLSNRQLLGFCPERLINGADDDHKIPKLADEISSTIDPQSQILYLYDGVRNVPNGDGPGSKHHGFLGMEMPLSTVKTVQYVDVTTNKDYWEVYSPIVNAFIAAETDTILAKYVGYEVAEWACPSDDLVVVDET